MDKSRLTPHQKAISLEMARLAKEACPTFAVNECIFSLAITEDARSCTKETATRRRKLQVVQHLTGPDAPTFTRASTAELYRLRMLSTLVALAMLPGRGTDKTTEQFLEMLPSFFDQVRLMGASLEEEYEAARRSSPGAS